MAGDESKNTTKKKQRSELSGSGWGGRRCPKAAGKTPTSTSEGAEIPTAAGKTEWLSEASDLRKLKKEAFEAKDLWKERGVPGALERRVEAKAEEAKAQEAQPKKRKLLVKRLPDTLIAPYLIEPIPAEELAKKSEPFRQMYTMRKYIDDKMFAYEQALINQYNNMGYAEDVTEVTDDEL
uniref:Uncharacterized protein n=1 Tax=Saccharum spontaneum TaxID=62335 RepID=A0A678T6A3_SACSP|nr:hypothetical protein SS91I14_000007 [Saccharum spontaneum]